MPVNPQVTIETPCPPQIACLCSTQVLVNGELEIPSQKPPMEQVISFSVEAEITDWEVINTPLGPKVIVSGKVCFGLEYVGLLPDQPVHYAHRCIPWHTFFLCDEAPCDVTVCVEYADYEPLDSRHIRKTVALFVCGVACPPPCPPCPDTGTTAPQVP